MSKSAKSVLIVGGSVILLAIIIFLVIFALNRTNSSESNSDNYICESYYTEEQLAKWDQEAVHMRILADVPEYHFYVGWFEDNEKRLEEERLAAEAEMTRVEEAQQVTQEQSELSTYSYSNESSGVLTRSGGVNYYNGRKETWYSQRVLPGGGLNIPGRHVESSDGTIRDENDYICVAASDLPYGTVVQTSLGLGKVYDSGCDAGVTDIYVDW